MKVKVNSENAGISSSIMILNNEYGKSDFKKYMHENWNKPYQSDERDFNEKG